ncbi:flippase [Chitinophaga varians]|uniref:flippase n=1 Tax=Chitinophaga varians TaxID=2202339 RepID=UPI00165F7639|nr:flippase [Chitinophaga varians]MBC9914807.1 flippase [Chitinophaga varians]
MRKVFENSSWLLIDKISKLFPGILVLALMARHLGPRVFGIWNYTIAFSTIMASIAVLGMDKLVIKELMAAEENHSRIVSTIAFMRLTAALACMLLSIFLVHLMNPGPVYLLCIIFSSFTVLLQSFDVMDGFYQVNNSLKTVIVPKVTVFLLFCAIKCVAIFCNATLPVFLWITLLELVTTYVWILGKYSLQFSPPSLRLVSRRMAWRLLGDSWVLIMANLVVVLFMKVDNILLNILATPEELGNYVVAVRISELWYALPTVVSTAMLPMLFRKKEEDQGAYLQTLGRWLRISCFISLSLAIVISLSAGMLIQLLYGSAYATAAGILRIHIWSAIPVFLMMVVVQYLFVEGKFKLYLYGNMVGLVLNVAINLVLIPHTGGKGAAIATVAAYFSVYLMMVALDKSGQAWFLTREMIHPVRIYTDIADISHILRKSWSNYLFTGSRKSITHE